MDNIPTWIAISISTSLAIVAAILVQLCLVPIQRKRIEEKLKLNSKIKFTIESSNGNLLLDELFIISFN